MGTGLIPVPIVTLKTRGTRSIPLSTLAGRIFDQIVNAFAIVAGLLLVAQMVAVCADVFTRYAFNKPIDGVNALTEWSLVYIAFLGAAWLQREKGHVRVDIVVTSLPRGPSRVLVLLGLFLGLFVTSIIVYYGTQVTWIKFIEKEYDFFKLSWMPLWLIFAVIPLGAALWFLQLCRDAAAVFVNGGEGSAERRIGD